MNEFQEQLNDDLKRIRFPKIYGKMVQYILDTLYFDGSAFGYKLIRFRTYKNTKTINISFTLLINGKNQNFYFVINPKDLKEYSITLVHIKSNKSWKLDNIQVSNYINSIGLLLYPDRLVKFENTQYTTISIVQ